MNFDEKIDSNKGLSMAINITSLSLEGIMFTLKRTSKQKIGPHKLIFIYYLII